MVFDGIFRFVFIFAVCLYLHMCPFGKCFFTFSGLSLMLDTCQPAITLDLEQREELQLALAAFNNLKPLC